MFNRNDNKTFYEFKLKSIIIYIPNINDDKSPIVFIESDEIQYDAKNFENVKPTVFGNIKTLRLIWKEKAMNGKELEVGLRDILTK